MYPSMHLGVYLSMHLGRGMCIPGGEDRSFDVG